MFKPRKDKLSEKRCDMPYRAKSMSHCAENSGAFLSEIGALFADPVASRALTSQHADLHAMRRHAAALSQSIKNYLTDKVRERITQTH